MTDTAAFPTSKTESPEDLLFAEARLGIEAEKFLSSDMGRYLVGRADMLAEMFSRQLEIEEDVDTIRKLQREIRSARRVKSWLAEAVNAGHAANWKLQEMDAVEDFAPPPVE